MSGKYHCFILPVPAIWPVFSYKLREIVGFGVVEMAISTNPKPTIYRNLYQNTAGAVVDPRFNYHCYNTIN